MYDERHGERSRRSLILRPLEEESDFSRCVCAKIAHVLDCRAVGDALNLFCALILTGARCKTEATKFALDPSCPGSNRGISATVRVQHSQRIRRPRLAVNGHEHPAPASQYMKDTAIVCLESDAPHRAGNTALRQTLIGALQCGDKRSPRHHHTKIVYVDRLRHTERPLDERGHLGR